MPGPGHSRPTPPDMRLCRKQSGPVAIWRDRYPIGRRLRGVLAVAFCGVFLFTLLAIPLTHLIDALQLQGIAALAVFFAPQAAGIGLLVFLFRPLFTSLQVVADRSAKSLTIARGAMWRRVPRIETYSAADVVFVLCIEKCRGANYRQLRIVLATGDSVFIEHGKELDDMASLCADVAAALGRKVQKVDLKNRTLLHRRLTRLETPSGQVSWLDVEERFGRAAFVAIFLGTSAALVGIAICWGIIVREGRLNRPGVAGEWFGLAWWTLMNVLIGCVWIVSLARLRQRRLLGVTLCKPGRSLTLLYRSRGQIINETCTSSEVAAVVRGLNSQFFCERVTLRFTDGQPVTLDRAVSTTEGAHLMDMADDIAETLGVPIHDEELRGVRI